MFNIKIISILGIFAFLFLGCEDLTKPEESHSPAKKNTLNDSDLGYETGNIEDYFYNFDEEIDANYLHYNSYITSGANTIINPSGLNPYLDTLNFHTFPFYTVEIENQLVAVSNEIIGLTPDNFDNYSTLYPLDETNTAALNWCNEVLVEYDGNCPDAVEVSFDSKIIPFIPIQEDTLYSPASFSSITSTKEVEFNIGWTNIKSLSWSSENNRYTINTEDTTYTEQAILCAGNCDSSFVDDSLPICSDTINPPCHNPNYIIKDFTDTFDSLIYVGVIDSSRIEVNDLMFIDRTEWERYDVEYKSDDKPLSLATTFTYHQIKMSDDSLMYRINGDCNQNLLWDSAEVYMDFGSDWCPDSLETGEGSCEVVDTNFDGLLSDEEPCNCLGDWREFIGGVLNENYMGDGGNPNWEEGSILDPNGDNWGDCGWDKVCPDDLVNDTNGDENGTEGNGVWDPSENMEENFRYDLDIITGNREFFIDKGNGVPDEPAEFCVKGDDGVCDSSDLFEDRNCNGKWDDAESGDKGNGIWDDDENFIINADGEKLLYVFSDRMETFIVDYSTPENPVPITEIDTNTTVTSYYGNIQDSVHISYSNFIENVQIEEYYNQKFHDIDRKETIYTNKIVEYALPGITDDYHVTKTEWFQDSVATSFIESDLDNPDYGTNYGYDYHLFKVAENGNIIKTIHPAYFYYYGYNYKFEDIEHGSWREELPQEEVYIYSVDGLLREGEEYYHDTTIVTSVADYYIEDLYEVAYSNVTVPFKQMTYNDHGNGNYTCINAPKKSAWEEEYNIAAPFNCPPVDTTLTNTYKITKTKLITMIGTGLEFGLRNTIWLGSAGDRDPLGIVKDQLEIRWSEPYWKEYGSSWRIMSILELRSFRKLEPEFSRIFGIFQPIKKVSLNGFDDEERFNNDPYVITPSFGIHKLSKPNDK